MEWNKLLVAVAAAVAMVGASADTLTFSGFANGSQAVRGILSNPNVTRDLTVSAGGFTTLSDQGSFVSYCVDYYQSLPGFGSANSSYNTADAGTFFGSRYDAVSRLFSGVSAQVDTALEQAAFQIALWELRYEAPGNAFNTASGSARFGDTYTGDGNAAALAQTYLNGLSGYDNAVSLYVMTSGTHQDVVWAQPVPEPSTYALMLAGLGAVGFVARRRRNSAA